MDREKSKEKIDAPSEESTVTENIYMVADVSPTAFGTSCLVCDEYVPLDIPFDRGYRICDKCKRAILKMREYMNED